ncbi:putative pentatricopeptide repeat-containing protein [Turnera subulata]|uniref:Pentatricopeptide repeat-containing protein n=1 Tax=Turnera subulata TaxID=218843 RepID=A0A9Q0F630_9ROSI|nr:putative pentatricopeptide repeat-containing protein [Turnera subulata]
MIRHFYASAQNKRRTIHTTTPTSTAFLAAAFPSPSPQLFTNGNHNNHPLTLKPQNLDPSIKKPPLIPLHDLVSHCKSFQSQLNPTPTFPPHNSGYWASFELYESLVGRYRDSCYENDAKQFHSEIFKHGFDGDLFLSNTLINVYVRIGDLASARKLFDEMPEKNGVTWACLISGYTRNGMPDVACRVFKGMISDGLFPNRFALGSALRVCQESALHALGMQIHGLILKSPFAHDLVLCNVLMSMYGSCLGYIDSARCVFDEMKVRNSTSWNSLISVYSQRGDAVSAFELFSSMQRESSSFGFKPNEYTFGSLVTAACNSIDSGFCLLEQMLTRVEKSGFLSDLYVGSALVGGFAKFGLFDHARKIFKQMSVRNAVTMNGLMVGLVRQKRGEEAAEVFTDMRNLVDINFDSYVILLSAFAEFPILEDGRRKGREVHGHAIRTGININKVAIGNGLINMYAKCGAIHDARSVFRLMVDKDSVSWNSMISSLDQNDCFEEAAKCYHEMRRMGFVPSNFSLISTLSSSASLGWIGLGQLLHGEAIKLGLDVDASVSNALLALYAETGYLAKCQTVFSLMPECDQVSWNTMIGALADSDESISKAVEYFLEMMRAGWSPTRVTFMNILGAVSSMSAIELSTQIHALMVKYCIGDDTVIENALLACYGKCGEIDHCEKVFSRMSERRDDVSWNSMISGYVHNEFLPKAIDLIWFMMQRGQRLDSYTFATVLSAFACVATLERGMEVHACAIRACLQHDVVIGTALVDMYSKCGRIDYASNFFDLMPTRNVYSWNSMISGYARHGHGEKALKRFRQMKLAGESPDHVTFVGVLSACSHVGMVDEGFNHFKSMTQVYGLAPRIEHYSCMVDLLGRAGNFEKLENFINDMPMKPNVLIWRTVLGACCQANACKTELGMRAAEMLFQLDPHNAANYVLLSNMYASKAMWVDMAKTRRAMREASVMKEAGCSWVTMKDGVHIFVSGDKSHPERDLIHEKLNELKKKMRDAGYVPQTKFALYDLDPENKEELLSYHSEKLAVAFVLSRNSGLPIRIMKNLRVCGDCHSAFKYISKIVNRPIVLRDSNRSLNSVTPWTGHNWNLCCPHGIKSADDILPSFPPPVQRQRGQEDYDEHCPLTVFKLFTTPY